MAETKPVPRGEHLSDKLSWSGRLTLTSRILFVNVLPLVLLGGGVLYLDSRERGRLLSPEARQLYMAGFDRDKHDIEGILHTVKLTRSAAQNVRDLIAGLRGRMTVIISSHILPEIEVTCDRVLIIESGRMVFEGTPTQLQASPDVLNQHLGVSTHPSSAHGVHA